MTNKIYNAFDKIKADDYQKESTKQYLSKKYREGLRMNHHRTMKYAVSVVCTMLFLVIGGVGFAWMRTPVSYVSIDVNPSIELGLNRFDRVVSVEAYNAEGEAILSGLPLKWKKYTEAIDAVIECEEMRTYLTDASDLVLTVVADSAREAKLTEGVKACTSHIERGCHNTQADINMVPQAHESGLSCGKYNAWLQLLQYDSTITIDACREMTMAQIQEMLRAYEAGDGNGGTDGSTENAGNEGNAGNAGSNGNNGNTGTGVTDGNNGNTGTGVTDGNNGNTGNTGTAVNDGNSGDAGNCGNGYGNGNGPQSGQGRHHHKGGSHE